MGNLIRIGVEGLGHKGVFPNVDFYSGLIYYSMGIDTKMFTPIFAVSRIAGWVARIIEYLEDNSIFSACCVCRPKGPEVCTC